MGTEFEILSDPASGSVTRQPETVKNAVRTKLPATKTTTAALATVSIGNHEEIGSDQSSKQTVFDRAAAEMVYRVVDNRTSLVVRQLPDQTQLRKRAYTRQIDAEKQRQTKLDQKA